MHNGIEVGLRIYTTTSGSGQNRSTHYYTEIHAAHRAPLRMGLTMGRSHLLGFNLKSGYRREVAIGHAELDSRYFVAATDPVRATRFLQDQALVDTIMSIDTSRWRDRGISISDTASSITLTRWELDAPDLVPHLDAVHRVCWQVNLRREAVPRSDGEIAAATALSSVAPRLSLELDEPGLRVTGSHLGNRVEVAMHYQSNGEWVTRVHARFPQHLGLGLKLQRDDRGFFSKVGALFGSQDIEVGHSELDEAFKIKGKPEDVVAELLRGDVGDRILALKRVAHGCVVDDEGVRASAKGILTDPSSLQSSITVVGELAQAMFSRAQGRMMSPYR